MKIKYIRTIDSVKVWDKLGRVHWSRELDIERECMHLNINLEKDVIKVTNKETDELICVIPINNVAFYNPKN